VIWRVFVLCCHVYRGLGCVADVLFNDYYWNG
jgi:hypothetical protein